jgi:acyl carrier protein
MNITGKAMSVVRHAIEQLNQQLPVDEKRVDPNPQTRLTGEDGCLDSLGLIDLITNTEKAASEEEHEYKR